MSQSAVQKPSIKPQTPDRTGEILQTGQEKYSRQDRRNTPDRTGEILQTGQEKYSRQDILRI
jgi:hypothetical protein